MVLAAAAAVFLVQGVGGRLALRRAARFGRWIEMGSGRRLFARERGDGALTVIFEAGIGATNLNWFRIQEQIAALARTIAYDREGLGLSSPCRAARTPARCAAELHTLLEHAGIKPPYVLVGHSFGGLVMRRFALEFPDEVASVVLVDPMRCDEWPPARPARQSDLDRAMRMARYAVPIARSGLARLAVTSLLFRSGELSRRLAAIAGDGALHVIGRVNQEIAKIPSEVLPLVAANWSRPEFYRGIQAHLEAIPATVVEMKDAQPIRGIPVLVLTPDSSTPLTDEHLQCIGDHARQVVVAKSAHWIHLDQPDAVVESIRGALEAAARESSIAAQ